MATTATSRVGTKENFFGFLTKKKVTYHRDIAKERKKLRADDLDERRYKLAHKKLEAEEKAAAAKIATAERKIAAAEKTIAAGEKKLDKGAMGEAQFQAMKARMEREIEAQERHKAAAQTKNPCAATRKERVSDRASRYRANQLGCQPAGSKKCALCQSSNDLMVDHIDGNESNGRKSNLRWLCRSCNTLLGAEMARTGKGRRTVQYNPGGAKTLGEYMQAILQHTRKAHDEGGKIIHDTPKRKREEYASQIWSARKARGNPAVSAKQYRLAQAVLSGTARSKMPRKVAQDLVGRTSAKQRSAFMKPNPAADAAALSKKFHGRPATTQRRIEEKLHVHKHLMEIGPLVRLVLDTPTGLVAVLNFNTTDPKKIVYLSSSERDPKTKKLVGKQLYLRGGDQEVNLAGLKMDSPLWIRDKMELGRLHEFKRGDPPLIVDGEQVKGSITYRARKGMDDFKLINYWHRAGEMTSKQSGPAARPLVLYDYQNKKLELAGGQYTVDRPGIIN